jgi:hypothetical protein
MARRAPANGVTLKADVWPLAPAGEIIVGNVCEEVGPDEGGART